MNDYFAGRLAHERQADHLREVEHDELVALAHGAQSPREAPAPSQARVGHPAQRRLWSFLGRFGPERIAARSDRP